MNTRAYNIKQIAEKIRVSIATVSRTLHPETRDKVAPETRRLVEQALQKYHYTPNVAARNLRKTTYKTIGILLPHHAGVLASDYYSQILSGAADALLETDHSLKMILIKPGKTNFDNFDFQHGESVDGLIMTYWRSLFSKKEVFEGMPIPCAIINNVEKNVKARFVAGDHFAGGWMAAEYLYSKGHRRIAVFSGAHPAPDAVQRFEGFRSFLKEKNIPFSPEAVFDVNFEEDRAYLITDKLLAAPSRFTAVFCMNDVQAHGVLRRLKDLKLSSPGRLSVMGYDDDRRSAHSSPALTSIKVPVYDLARTAVNDLLKQLKDKTQDFYEPKYFPVSLVERSSVGQIKSN